MKPIQRNRVRKLTNQEVDYIKKVVSKRGDLEQTEHFKILKPILDSHYPKILQAWKSYKQSVKTLDNLTQSLTTL